MPSLTIDPGGSLTCKFSGVSIPTGAVRLVSRARTSEASFQSEQIPVPPSFASGAPVSPGLCVFVSDTFFDPPDDEPSGLVAPIDVLPRTTARNMSTGQYAGKPPEDGGDEATAQRVCGSTSFEYTARFGPFSSTACGTYAATNLVRARPADGPSGTAVPADLGLVSIVVEGCPKDGPAASLAAPELSIIKEHEWALRGGPVPGAVVLRAGPGEASVEMQLRPTRRLVGESYEVAGNVTIRNPTGVSWGLNDVLIEAVRPSEITPLLTQSADCPANDAGTIIVPAGSAAKPATLTCSFSLISSTPDPGVITAVAVIAGEVKNGSGTPVPGKGLPTAAPGTPVLFSFSGPGVARRIDGECASLFGSFAEAGAKAGGAAHGGGRGGNGTGRARGAAGARAAAAAVIRGALTLEPNTTGDGAPPSSGFGQKLCTADSPVTFQIGFKGLSNRACNRYVAVYTAVVAPIGTGRSDGPPEVSKDFILDALLTGCPALPGQPGLSIQRVAPLNVSTYTWSTTISLAGGSPAGGGKRSAAPSGAPSPPGGGAPAAAAAAFPGGADLTSLLGTLARQGLSGGVAGGTPTISGGSSSSSGGGGSGRSSSSGGGGSAQTISGGGGSPGGRRRRRLLQRRRIALEFESLEGVSAAVGKPTTVGVRAEFKRRRSGLDYRLSGALELSNPNSAPQKTGAAYIMIVLSNGTALRTQAHCPDRVLAPGEGGGGALLLPAAPERVTCSWALGWPLAVPIGGQIAGMIASDSPAPMSALVPFSFATAKAQGRGACAAVSANWTLDAGKAGGALPQLTALGSPSPASGGNGSSSASSGSSSGSGPAPGAPPARLCDTKAFSWPLQLGPVAAAQCPALGALELVGAAAAEPTSGGQEKQTAAARARVAVSGCPPPPPPSAGGAGGRGGGGSPPAPAGRPSPAGGPAPGKARPSDL